MTFKFILCFIISIISFTEPRNEGIEIPIRVRTSRLDINTNTTLLNLQQLSCSNNRTYVFVQRGYRFGFTTPYAIHSNVTCNVTAINRSCKMVNNTACDSYKIDGVYNTARYNYKVLYTIACRNLNYYTWGSIVSRVNSTCFQIQT